MKDKLNRKQKRFQTNRRAFILMTVLCMGIGFAFLSSNLTITGNTSVSGNSWNVYFTNVQVTDGSVDATVVPTTSGTNTTSIDYTVTLDKPGDFYEFTVDAVNNGTIDAMIQSINMTSLDTDVEKYLSYTATYLDGTELAQNDILEAEESTTYKVRVEFKKNILAEDLSEESTNLTLTFGVNYVQSTIKAPKFVESAFAKLVSNSALSDSNIDFTQMSSASNGRGLYVMHNTTEDDYPIYYYRGNVNNNAKFAGFCWKIVRTTETGGTKLIYNGEIQKNYSNYSTITSENYTNILNDQLSPFTYDNVTNSWINDNVTGQIDFDNPDEVGTPTILSFSFNEAGDYLINYSFDGYETEAEIVFQKDGVDVGNYKSMEDLEGSFQLNNVDTSTVITVKLTNMSYEDTVEYPTSTSFSIEKGVGEYSTSCDAVGKKTQLSSTSAFNINYDSPAYNGYMYGAEYKTLMATIDESHVYGNTFTYENGIYTLSDTNVGVDNTHHYTCLSSGTTCESINYVFYTTSSYEYYITLTGGKSVEDAFTEMNTNTNSSTVKTTVDNWFNNTFKTYFTKNNKNYNNYLEDTIWCNDRSMNTLGIDDTKINNGWKPNGGSTGNFLLYSAYGRANAGIPTLVCSNKNDSFTVTESATGNGALTYPVGLLTADEIVMAGGKNSWNYNTDFYLYTGSEWWTMSPDNFSASYAYELRVDSSGELLYYGVAGTGGVRPSISLKPGVKIADGGDGTAATPYEFVVE